MGKKSSLKEKAERAFREGEERRREAAKAFDIDEVLRSADEIREVYVPELRCVVRYKPLTIEDLPDLMKAKDDQERAAIMLYKLLSKADEKVTLEKVKKLPVEVATAILAKIVPQTRPLGLQP